MVNNEATFLMSNMIPQTPYLNRVIWKNLEQYSRDLVQKEGKKLYIVAGPIYDQNFGAIGPQKDIPVPSKEFKIIYILESNQTLADIDLLNPAIAVLMPNVLQDGSIPDTLSPANCNTINKPSIDRMDWQKYTTTLNEIERLSGLHFFHSKK
jgi:endonuclease G